MVSVLNVLNIELIKLKSSICLCSICWLRNQVDIAFTAYPSAEDKWYARHRLTTNKLGLKLVELLHILKKKNIWQDQGCPGGKSYPLPVLKGGTRRTQGGNWTLFIENYTMYIGKTRYFCIYINCCISFA